MNSQKIKSLSLLFLIIINLCAIAASFYLYLSTSRNYLIDKVSIHPVVAEDWQTEDDSITLYGEIHYPFGFNTNVVYPSVLLFHGYGRSLNDYSVFIKDLNQRGILCFAIDFRGFGKSTGTFPSDGALYNASFGDAMAAFQYLRSHPNVNKSNIVALGTSLGAGSSLFLAVMNQTNKFVLWYPAVDYYLGNKLLFEYDLPFSNAQALIMVGTEDECTRCKPQDVQYFVDRNGLEIYWLQGARHTDSRYYQEVVSHTLNWFENLWNLPKPTLIQSFIANQILTYGILGAVVLIDILYFVRLWIVKRKR